MSCCRALDLDDGLAVVCHVLAITWRASRGWRLAQWWRRSTIEDWAARRPRKGKRS